MVRVKLIVDREDEREKELARLAREREALELKEAALTRQLDNLFARAGPTVRKELEGWLSSQQFSSKGRALASWHLDELRGPSFIEQGLLDRRWSLNLVY